MTNEKTFEQQYAEVSDDAVKQNIRTALAAEQATLDHWSDKFVTYLTFTNGGAATAMLAFLGSALKLPPLPLRIALAMFVLGIAIVGALWTAQGLRLLTYDRNLHKAAIASGNGDMQSARQHMIANASPDPISRPAFAWALISGACFVFGCLSVGASVFLI